MIAYNNKHTSFETTKSGIQLGSILGPLLFLIYVNSLNQALNILSPTMFADDTNFFYSQHQIKNIFETVNCVLKLSASGFINVKYKKEKFYIIS